MKAGDVEPHLMRTAENHVDVLIERLRERVDEMADRMVEAYVEQIPSYAGLPDEALSDVRQTSRRNLVEWFRSIANGTTLDGPQLAEFAESARRRARSGISLESLLHAYRIGATVAWEQITAELREGTVEQLSATLEVAGALMRYLDRVSTVVAQSYLEEREHLVTSEERHHRRIAEAILASGPSSSEASEAAAFAGISLAERYRVLAVSAAQPTRTLRRIAQRLRTCPASVPVVATPWSEEVVLALWPEDPGALAGIAAACDAIRREYPDVRTASAGPAGDAMEPVFAEAIHVLRLPPARVRNARLEDALLDAMIGQAGGRITDVVRAVLVPLESEGRNTELLDTLLVYLESDASVGDCALRLRVHRNTVAYRLERIRALTGLDPRKVDDLFILRAATSLRTR